MYTLAKLIRRGKILENGCYMCRRGAETCNHLLLWCCSLTVLVSCIGLLGLNWIMAGSMREELWAWKAIHNGKHSLRLAPF